VSIRLRGLLVSPAWPYRLTAAVFDIGLNDLWVVTHAVLGALELGVEFINNDLSQASVKIAAPFRPQNLADISCEIIRTVII